MKRKHSPPPLTLGFPENFDSIHSPLRSRNQELDDIDSLLSQPLVEPTDESVQEFLDWLDSLWVPEEGPSDAQIIPRPFPWAMDCSGTRLHSLEYMLHTLHINTVSADFQCNSCGNVQKIEHNLSQKYKQILRYINKKGLTMGGVAPISWLFPTRPQCKNCQNKRRSLGQVITEKESSINWLFLFMGKLIGCCKVQQLRTFCEQNKIECSGPKPRLVYLTYLCIYKQLSGELCFVNFHL